MEAEGPGASAAPQAAPEAAAPRGKAAADARAGLFDAGGDTSDEEGAAGAGEAGACRRPQHAAAARSLTWRRAARLACAGGGDELYDDALDDKARARAAAAACVRA